jgi:hypothetical protein
MYKPLRKGHKEKITMKVYCSISYQQGSCPKCGMSLAPVKYYSAIQGKTTLVAQNQEIDWTEWKKITTTTQSTQYFDIQLHTGSMCLNCCNKAENMKFLVPRILFGIGVLSLIIAVIFAMVVVGIIAVVLSFIGWNTIGSSNYDGLKTSKKYTGKKEFGNVNVKDKGEMNVLSRLLMKYISTKKIPKGRVLLSTDTFEDMKI